MIKAEAMQFELIKKERKRNTLWELIVFTINIPNN
jgi:hypothetical protein